jgi:hypothetical protein
MTPTRSHTRPPNKFRSTSLIVAAIVTTVVVALGVGTASASVRGKGGHRGFGNGQQAQQRGNGQAQKHGNGQQNKTTAASTSSASATDSASAGASDTAAATASPAATGPVASDFVDINQVQPLNDTPQVQANGSTGSFGISCGNNEDKHFNSDNVIVAPGVTNGAHHLHDYVGNTTTTGASTDDSLAAGGTTCTDGDQSTYYWPVARDLTQTQNQIRVAGEDPADLNVGLTLRPKVEIQYVGNATSKVVAMPKFLRILSGDAKSLTDGGANQHVRFTCTGFGNRISTDKYTLCPGGKGFTRISEFPSCWDGKNIDSANHRTHVVFPDASGACQNGFVAIPELKITMTYKVPAGPNFAVDGFPEELHAPINDHNDFIEVMPDQLQNQIVSCINSGKKC